MNNFDVTDNYRMDRKNMGIALIFNFDDFEMNVNNRLSFRKGSDKDVEALKNTLEQFRFEVRIHKNLESVDVEQVIKEVSEENHENNNCLLVSVLSHGTENGSIFTNDSDIDVKNLWTPFAACSSLVGKPKIFFIQACRGKLKDIGATLSEDQEVDLATEEVAFASRGNISKRKLLVSTLADILIYFSCAEGYPSFRNNVGSWFIQSICENLKRVLNTRSQVDLMTILLRVNRQVAFSKQANTPDDYNACKQMPMIMSMLTKNFVIGEKESDNDA